MLKVFATSTRHLSCADISNITNLCFADVIDWLVGSEDELAILVKKLIETSSRFDSDKQQEDKTDDKK